MKNTILIGLFLALALISLQPILSSSSANQDKYQIVREYSEGLAAVNNGEKRYPNLGIIESPGVWGYIDMAGKLVLPMKFTHAESFHEGLAAVELDHRTGFIDHEGKMQFEAPFDVTMGFHQGIVALIKGGAVAYYDKTGKRLATPPIDPGPSYHSFSEGLAAIATQGKTGFIDTSGKLVIAAQYEDAGDFSEGLAAVQVKGELRWCPPDASGSRQGSPKRFGYIDTSGAMVIPPQFESAGAFHDGWAPVSDCERRGSVDRNGKTVWSQR